MVVFFDLMLGEIENTVAFTPNLKKVRASALFSWCVFAGILVTLIVIAITKGAKSVLRSSDETFFTNRAIVNSAACFKQTRCHSTSVL